ncbi:TonB Periplasmic protein TonB, links inner and outer membranes [Burkholderiaceae bacterium]
MPTSINAPPKPFAYQAKTSSSLGATLIVVAFVHVLVIVLLLSHFGWFGVSDPEADPDATAGQSGIVIPVTLETAQRAQETPSPEPESEPEPEPEPMSAPEATQEPPAPVAAPMDSPSAPEPEIAPTAEPTVEPIIEPTVSQKPDLSSMPEAPAQTRVKSATSADSGKAAGPVQQRSEPATFPLTPAHVDPNYLHRPNPVYPALSKRLREEGTVLLRVNLDAQGIVLDISIEKSSSFQRLDQAAHEAVKQWRFIPAKRGQEAMPSTALVPIEFKQQ